MITDTLLDCGVNGWLMIASAAVAYGVLALAGAGLVKYLFFTGHDAFADERIANPQS